MAKRMKARRRNIRRVDFGKVLSVILTVLCPPVGLFMVWRTRWSNSARYCLSALGVACLALMVSVLPLARLGSDNGGIHYVERKPEVEVYGPEFPTAMVTGYAVPYGESVFYNPTTDPEAVYVYATPSKGVYHASNCTKRSSTDQQLSVYEAHFHGYSRCPECNPPEYVPGTL